MSLVERTLKYLKFPFTFEEKNFLVRVFHWNKSISQACTETYEKALNEAKRALEKGADKKDICKIKIIGAKTLKCLDTLGH